MRNRDDQNGCQPPLPAQPRPPHESGTETENGYSNDKPKQICRNYVWGTCKKNAKCIFRHELDVGEMKKILKFCHDYQNRTGCTREDCTYLHTTREEENLFLATGQIPRVLAERHATMSASTNVETIPQIAMFIRDSYVTPISVPASTPLSPAVPPPPMPRPAPPPPMPTIPVTAVTSSLPVPQPPPPPPPPPPTIPTTTIAKATAPVYTAPPPQSTPMICPINQPPPPLPVLFDASRPPPALPNQILTKSGAVKHKSQNSCEAGPNKTRKPEDPNVADAHCENCVRREIRIDLYKQEMDILHCEQEYQTSLYKKKLAEYESGKDILRSFVSPELFRILEENIEGVPQLQIHDILSPLNQTSFGSGMSTVTKQFLLQLMDYVFGNTRSVMDSAPSQQTRRLDESLLQSLSAQSRRTNTVISNTSSSDVVQAFVDLLRNSNFISDKTQLSDLKSETKRISTTNGHTTGINGLNHSTNSQKTDCSTVASVGGANRYSSSSAPVRQYPAESVIVASTAETKPTAPPPPYPSYQPSVPPPPPTSSYNTQLFTAPSNSLQNVCPPITQPTPARSSTTAAIPKHPDNRNYNQYLIGRFPPPHYYSPFQ